MEEQEKNVIPEGIDEPVVPDGVAESVTAEAADTTASARRRRRKDTSENGEEKRKRKWWVVLLVVLASVTLVLLLVCQIAYWILFGMVNNNVNRAKEYSKAEVDATPVGDIVDDIVDATPNITPGEVEDLSSTVKHVKNIALFGVDQENGSVGRSDTMIILSINRENNTIKMTSLARDSLVPIEGHGEEKLTHSWAYGHAKLALKTINQAYGMNITDYVYVNFEEFVDVIDYIGGVTVHVNKLELEAINYTPDKSERLSGTGTHRLTGRQALVYARCRKDSDKNRTARQREVLIAMYEQVRKQPITKLPETLRKVLRLCHTTLSAEEIMDMAKWAILETPTIQSLSLPNSQLKPWSGILDRARGWVYVYDLSAAKRVLYNFIYGADAKVTGVTQYVPSTTATQAEDTMSTSPSASDTP